MELLEIFGKSGVEASVLHFFPRRRLPRCRFTQKQMANRIKTQNARCGICSKQSQRSAQPSELNHQS